MGSETLNPDNVTIPGQPAVDQQALAEVTGGGVPATQSAVGGQVLDEVTGEIIDSDINRPWLYIAYGVGALSAVFNPGDWVLAKTELLQTKGKPLNVVLLSAKAYWKEYLRQFTPGITPKTYPTAKEVLKNGGTVAWSGDGPTRQGPSYSRALTMDMLIEKPEGLMCGYFGLDILGKSYAPARFTVDKTAFKFLGKTILTNWKLSLKQRGLMAAIWAFQTESKLVNSNQTTTPTAKIIGWNTPEFIAAVKAALGAPIAAPEGLDED